MTQKQKEERYHSEPILKHLNVREEQITPSDSPDMLLTLDDGSAIGIEVVLSYPTDGGDGRYVLMINRAGNACEAYERHLRGQGLTGEFVRVSFRDAAYQYDPSVSSHQFEKTVIKEIALKREQAEHEKQLSAPSMRELYMERMADGYYDTKYVESVSASPLANHDLVEVSQVRTGYYMAIAAESVTSCIAKKEKKLYAYKAMTKNRAIREYWLFICNPTDAFCDLEGFERPSFESSFDRIYITDGKTVLRLK